MRRGFITILLLVNLLWFSLQLSAQDAYRSSITGPAGQWTDAANWQRFDTRSGAWIKATHFPTHHDGTITIQPGDSMLLIPAEAGTITIDQVVIEKGASLVLSGKETETVMLQDGTGDDMVVNGSLHISTPGNIKGKGNIQVNAGALLSVMDNAQMSVSITNDGVMHWGGNGQNAATLLGCHVTNNNRWVWRSGNLYADSATTFVNNGRMEITALSNVVLASDKNQRATFVNKGIIVNGAKTFTVDLAVKLNNSGTLGGVGTYVFSGGINAAGTISPGSSPGHLTLGPGALKSPVINLEISTTGAVAGVNYDWLTVHSLQDLNGATINVSATADDPVNTVYTVIDAVNMPEDKPYPEVTVSLPANFSWEFVGHKLIIKKISAEAVSVSWGGFRAVANGNNVTLDWNAMVDKRTAYFVVEHSTNATDYKPIGKVEAQQGASEEVMYHFNFAEVDLIRTNYFRIKQVNADGRCGYSVAREVRFDKGAAVALQINTDMEKEELQLNVQTANVRAFLSDQAGKVIQHFTLTPGQHTVYIDELESGMYRLDVLIKDVLIETRRIVKQ